MRTSSNRPRPLRVCLSVAISILVAACGAGVGQRGGAAQSPASPIAAVRTGLAYVLIGYYALVVNGAFVVGNVASLAVLAGVFIFGVACFILPLLGIHDRLVREKELLLRGVEERLGRLGDEMYRRVDEGQFDGTKAVSDSIAGVATLRDRVARLPTWPWPPNVLRGFLSALLIPVIVYLASRLIGGQVGV